MTAGFRSAHQDMTGIAPGSAGADPGTFDVSRREQWPVSHIVRHAILQCPGQTPVSAAARMMADAACSSIIVTEDGKPAGIWTERDALGLDLSDRSVLSRPIRTVMSSPVITIPDTTTVEEAMPLFREAGIRHFLVVDAEGTAIGVLSRTDVVRNSGLHGYLTLRTIGSVARQTPILVPLTATVAEAANLLRSSDAEAALVMEADGRPYGIVTERDVLRLVARQEVDVVVRDIAGRPLISLPADAPLLQAQETMEARRIRHLGVEDATGAVTSILSFTDILKGVEVDYLRHLQDAVSRQVQALEAGRQRQRAILELTQEGYAEVDDAGRLTDCNTAFETLIGSNRTSLLGLPLAALAEGESARRLESGFAEARDAATSHHDFETIMRRGDGDSRFVRISVTTLRDAAGRPTGAFAFFNDITSLRAGEVRQQALLSQLSQSNAELEAFAYIISHDLQEPLRMVASYLQLIERRLGDALDPESREFMDFAVGGAARMQSMITDLLDYSRIDRKGRPFELGEAGVAVESAVRRLETTLERAAAQVTWDSLPSVTADFPQLVRLFQHLIDNAVKFRDPKRPVRVHVSCERDPDLPGWRFLVEDNGIGIEPRFADRIFLMFQRLNARGAYAGNGIGLAICKRIAERHGGHISVTSEPGKGSTFAVTLPDRPPEPETAA